MSVKLPDLSLLTIEDPVVQMPAIPDDIEQSDDPALRKLATFAKALPYPIESNARMQKILDFYLLRLVQCVEAKDYDLGLLQWDGMLM
jgi:proteasome activator subunit 4